ncbi:mRNA-decapping enzyme subunit 2 [Entomortierella parvispora]|uniref:mRNA-decapping enzyme subunit 2 n=1 Tax=Entomortierella parvispora TaxID=205924 RepID=A0A9P3H143_9FUNG|nr:mRNA-decapping enzyme subunit 2 [Entomortierella parvispora]
MAWANATFNNVLDDLSSRFIINVPDEELASVERIFFQIEQAHWFYEDFIREQNSSLPSFSLKNFSAKFFHHCPLLHEWSDEHETAFVNFMEYKIRVPVCGAIILNETMDKCILVKGWAARSGWGFPKGKINKDEPDTDCAVREVWEETGFDISSRIRDEDYVEQTMKDQRIRLYIIKSVPEDTVFEPQTRKEISKIEWHLLTDLPAYKPKTAERGSYSGKESGSERPSNAKNPSRYYMVTPFLQKLKNWIAAQRRNAKRKGGQNNTNAVHPGHQGPHSHPSAHHHTNGHHVPLPVVSTTAAQADSEILKNMLGIGKPTSPPKDAPATHSRDHSSSSSSARPSTGVLQTDTQNSSESLKALLGIQPNGFTVGGVSPSPVLHSASPAMATPASNGSDALKAMLGIPTSSSSNSLSQVDHNQSGSPFQARAFANQSPRPLHQQALSPPSYHPSPNMSFATSSPHMGSPALANGRKSSMDLLALLNSGGNNNPTNGQGSNGFRGPRDVNSGASPLLAHFLQPRMDNGGLAATHGSDNGHGNGQGTWHNNVPTNQFDYGVHGNTRPLSHSSTSSTSSTRGSFPIGGASLNGTNGQRSKASSMQDFKFDLDALV